MQAVYNKYIIVYCLYTVTTLFQVAEWQPSCFGMSAGFKKMAKEFITIPEMK